MVDLKVEALDQALALFHVAFRSLVAEPDRRLAQRRLGRTHHRILYLIRRRPGITVGALVRALAVTKQAVNTPLRELVDQRLVAAAAAPNDGRTKLLRLTANGTSLERRLSGEQRERLLAAFDAAGPRAADGWTRVMDCLARSAE